MLLLTALLWKVLTGFLMLGALLDWWPLTPAAVMFFLPDVLAIGFLWISACEGRRIRKAAERAARRAPPPS